ncbi:MAG: recombinase family protein [Deltaproteobacteria bacterium]|nr:recombinase family protein [Deltaproteobacteria bacterium]
MSVVRAGGDDFTSCEVQRELCEHFVASRAADRWVVLPERFDDRGYGGATVDRPALEQLLKRIEVGEVDRLVVYRLDRLTRSVIDWGKLLSKLRHHGVQLTLVAGDIGGLEAATSDLMLNVLASFAEFEREIIGERLRESRALRRKRGLRSAGLVPFGFRSDPVTRQLKPVTVDAEVVRQIFERVAGGARPSQVATWLNELGLPTKKSGAVGGGTWSAKAVLRLIRNPVYAGEIGGARAAHAPVVLRELFDRANEAVLARRSRAPGRRVTEPKGDPFLLRGLVRCIHCERLMSTASGPERRRNAPPPRYYRCRGTPTCRGTQVSAQALEQRVLGWLHSATPCASSADAAFVFPALEPIWPVLFPQVVRRILQQLIREVRWDGRRNRFTVALNRAAIEEYARELRGAKEKAR